MCVFRRVHVFIDYSVSLVLLSHTDYLRSSMCLFGCVCVGRVVVVWVCGGWGVCGWVCVGGCGVVCVGGCLCGCVVVCVCV